MQVEFAAAIETVKTTRGLGGLLDKGTFRAAWLDADRIIVDLVLPTLGGFITWDVRMYTRTDLGNVATGVGFQIERAGAWVECA